MRRTLQSVPPLRDLTEIERYQINHLMRRGWSLIAALQHVRSVKLPATKLISTEGRKSGHRPISAIAYDISQAWSNIPFPCRLLLNRMLTFTSITDPEASCTVTSFLALSSTFRGQAARTLKAELRSLFHE